MTAARIGAAAALMVVVVACSPTEESGSASSTSTPTAESSTTVPKPPVERTSCEAAFPATWQQAIDASAVDTGGVSTVPLAVGAEGDVVAVRDNGDTRDVLMINADKSVREIYPVPEPNRNNVGFAAMDDSWLVIGVDRIPRNSNGVLPGLIRVDVMDRKSGAVRMVAEQSEADYGAGANSLDSVALFDGKVYWITRETYAGKTGTLRSFDPVTGTTADVQTGTMSSLRATPAGLVWDVESGDTGRRFEVKIPAAGLPAPVDEAVGTGRDRVGLATDGTAYAWLTGFDRDAAGVAWWSADQGLVRVQGDIVHMSDFPSPVYVVGPYVFVSQGRGADHPPESYATVIDTRSGAVTGVPVSGQGMVDHLWGADGGTVALTLWAGTGKGDSKVGLVRSDALPELYC